tara:strand:+ start:3680 stop:4078 length:399 start_codon:yes stop_codon:yes gene_type:complete
MKEVYDEVLHMKAEIIGDGTGITVVRYNGNEHKYTPEFRSKFETEQEFLDMVFNDFYEKEGSELDLLYEQMDGDATICLNCSEWFSFDKPDETKYNAVECSKCGWYMLLSKTLPEIPEHLAKRVTTDYEEWK